MATMTNAFLNAQDIRGPAHRQGHGQNGQAHPLNHAGVDPFDLIRCDVERDRHGKRKEIGDPKTSQEQSNDIEQTD